MLLDTLASNAIRNMLTSKVVIRASRGTIRAGEEAIRAGQNLLKLILKYKNIIKMSPKLMVFIREIIYLK